MSNENADALRKRSLPNLQGHSVAASSIRSKEIGSVSTSSLSKKKVPEELCGVHSKDNVHKALKLMRKVDIPHIRTEHNYSQKKIFGAVSKIPLQSIAHIKKSAHISLHEKRIRVSF